MASLLEGSVEDLKVKSIIGFDGATIGGLRIHPDGRHVIYPVGDKVTILDWDTRKQNFLSGHTNVISALDLSKSGKYIASGQINHIGFRALVIIWSFETRTILSKHEVHKVRVESVAFSKGDTYLISLGGRDCSSIVVWDLNSKKALCGAQASKGIQGEASTICVTNRRKQCFVTAGEGTLTVWRINHDARKLDAIDVNVSKLKRTIVCMVIDKKDEMLYCGTTTGDILKIRLNYHHDAEILEPTSRPVMIGCYAKLNEKKKLPQDKTELYSMGVRALMILDKKILLVGSGDGQVDVVEEIDYNLNIKQPSTPQLRVLKTVNVRSMVTSFTRKNEDCVLIGTLECEIFSIQLKTFKLTLLISCHPSTVYDLAFPHNYSEVFATASKNDVRIWNLNTMEELLRIKVENFCCSSVLFSADGKSILTAWNDGIIRSFTPLTGRLIYAILNAHNKGVSALALTSDDKMLISGGCEGQVRLWEVTPVKQSLICTLKEHKGPISAIHINKFSDEAVSASTDGTCIIWDIIRKCRKQILFANTLFMCVRYHPTGVQILTGGSDRKIGYWEVFDGQLIRELEGSTSAGLNALDIAPDGNIFVTGGNDQIVKLWKYEQGITTHVGVGHSAVLTAIRFSPNGKNIVSASASGSIFVWNCPEEDSTPAVEEKTKKIQLQHGDNGNDKEEHISDLKTKLETNIQANKEEEHCCDCKG